MGTTQSSESAARGGDRLASARWSGNSEVIGQRLPAGTQSPRASTPLSSRLTTIFLPMPFIVFLATGVG